LGEYASARAIDAEFDRLYLEVDRLTVQRKLKDAGRFVFIQQQKGDSSYLKYIEPSLQMVRAACVRRAQDETLGPLGQWLDQVLV
jgi:aminoglycoside/choline kinase family phosphotransferase